MKVALISGTSIVRSTLFESWARETIDTPYGAAVLCCRGDLAILNRHGPGDPLPPHAINYRANIAALHAWGAAEAVSLNSVGSLRRELPPGTFVSCDDYVSFAPVTFHDTTLKSLAPEVPNRLVGRLLEGSPFPVTTGCVYVQTRGPRFETRAEVRVVRSWGDVVGMTMANEADLCQEAGIGYNSFCMVDNFAHGLADAELSPEAFQQMVRQNQERVDTFLRHIIGVLQRG